MIYIIACISSFLSGLGIGGGSIFILFSMLFKILDLNEARTYNLLLFICVGVVISIKNFKNIKNDKSKYIKGIVFLSLGAIIGTFFSKHLSEKITKILFYIFFLLIGFYEIIVSLKNIKMDKNISKKGEN
ncbi:MAG: TSUP family transporter [Clostridia bacterium]